MSKYWIPFEIYEGTVGSTYEKAHKIECSGTFADLIEQLRDVQNDRVSRLDSYLETISTRPEISANG